MGLGLAGPHQNLPSGHNVLEDLYYSNQINQLTVSLDYNWNIATKIQLGYDPETFTFPSTEKFSFEPSMDADLQGWHLNFDKFSWGDDGLDYDGGTAVLLSNYDYISVPQNVYDAVVMNLPAGFSEFDHGANHFMATNDTTVCSTAHSSMPPITIQMDGFNFTIPVQGYIVDFIAGTPGTTHLFDMDKCVLMMQPPIFPGTNTRYGLGDAFLWSFFTQLNFNNNTMSFQVGN